MDQRITQLTLAAALLSIGIAFILGPAQGVLQLPIDTFDLLLRTFAVTTFILSIAAGLLLIIDSLKK